MSIDERRKHLSIKTLGVEHLDQYDALLRYVFQVTNRDLRNSGYDEDELTLSKRPILERAEVIGWFNDKELISQLSIYPCRVNIHGSLFPMGGLTGVGTYPEYANLRLMTDLIRVALERMREKQLWISYLYPYSVPFYRKKGWEIMSERLTFQVLDSQLPKPVEVTGFVERHPVDHEDVITTYDRFARLNHGAMIRDAVEWEEYWRWENEEERTAAIYYEQDEPQGYILYWVEKDIFHVKEMIYLTQEARLGLWNFISAHFSMVDRVEGNIFKNEPIAFLMEDSQIKESIAPYYMARIVDVAAFLARYPFARPGQAFHFEVSDPMVEWNRGIFGLTWNKGEININREPVGPKVCLDIRTLSSMLMSFRRPTYFQEVRHMDAAPEALPILESIIPATTPYFSDYF